VGSPIKKFCVVPKKGKGKENVHEPNKELPMHVNLHSSTKESSGEDDSLLVPLKATTKTSTSGAKASQSLTMTMRSCWLRSQQ